jgi:integral membrane protein
MNSRFYTKLNLLQTKNKISIRFVFLANMICFYESLRMTKEIKALQQLRWIGIIEGVSYLVLLFISMPLKYIFKLPKPVIINGWIHGFLFVLLAVAILYVWILRKWPFKRAFVAGVASLLPFGTFWFDKSLKKEVDELLGK